MTVNKDFFNNTVSSKDQLKGNQFVSFDFKKNEQVRVLFVGNSITRHGILEEIGWFRDCGMAASAIENDYVHKTVSSLEERYGNVSFCIAQIAEWERDFYNDSILEKYRPAKEFNADIVIIRVGENVHNSDEELIEHDFYSHFNTMANYFFGNAKQKIITSLFWGRDAIDSRIKKVAEENGCGYVSISHLSAEDACKALNEYEHEGVALHPSDLGMKKISEAILEKIV